MNTKQTAVDWLIYNLTPLYPSIKELKFTIALAKEMEKQQIMQAVYDSMGTNFDPNMGRAEQYYNETFKPE